MRGECVVLKEDWHGMLDKEKIVWRIGDSKRKARIESFFKDGAVMLIERENGEARDRSFCPCEMLTPFNAADMTVHSCGPEKEEIDTPIIRRPLCEWCKTNPIGKKSRKYCSEKCQQAAKRERDVLRKRKQRKGDKGDSYYEFDCIVCGKHVVMSRSAVGHKYCSEECRRIVKRKANKESRAKEKGRKARAGQVSKVTTETTKCQKPEKTE